MANIKFKVILGMPFLKISNVDVVFGKETLTWKLYTTNKALPNIEQVQLVDLNKFVIAMLNADSETFVVHVAIQEQKKMVIDPVRKTQIEAQSGVQNGAQVEGLIFNKAPIEVPVEYSNYSNVFSAENVAELLENIGINEHAIELKKGK